MIPVLTASKDNNAKYKTNITNAKYRLVIAFPLYYLGVVFSSEIKTNSVYNFFKLTIEFSPVTRFFHPIIETPTLRFMTCAPINWLKAIRSI